jgi:hypothetical protein
MNHLACPLRRPARVARAQRGSLLIVAMLLSVIIGISLVSYIKLATNSHRLADRSFLQISAMNLAEIGAEEALYCYNRLDNVSSPQAAWAGTNVTWQIAADNSATATLAGFPAAPGATGVVKIYCSHFNLSSGRPKVAVRATITPAQGPPLDKWLEVTLRKRSLWAHGMVARSSIVWNGGNSSADSWNSDHDDDPATPGVPYGSANGPAKANATVGTPSSVNGAVDVGGGAIRGELLNGGGTILKNTGAILSDTTTGTGWDSSLVSSDFDATFPPVAIPAPPVASKNIISATQRPITFSDTLPRAGDVDWNGTYYYEFGTGYSLASAGNDSNVVTIAGNVVFLATNHSGINVIDLGGQASIKLTPAGRLAMYTNGNIEAAGNGIVNATATPDALLIYGTHPSPGGQEIRFVGNADAIAAIYAPNATFQLRGNGSLHGAVVADSINLNGNAAFHYDEALGTATAGNPFGISRWRELRSAAERAEYAGKL